MPLHAVDNPYPVILNQIGGGLNGGHLFIGMPNQDPQTNPKPVFWDVAGTDPADQTSGIDIIGGYIRRSGTPASVYIDGSYSVRVRDRFGAQVYYSANVIDFIAEFEAAISGPDGANLIGFSLDTDATYGGPGGPPSFEQFFTATADQAAFVLEQQIQGDAWVFINGALQSPSSYAIAGYSLTLDDPCSVDDVVRIADFEFMDGPDQPPTAGTVAAKLQQFPNPLDYPYLAKGDGVTDDRDALTALDAVGPMIITRNHRIATSATLSSDIMFIGLGRLTIDSGATVTLTGRVIAPRRQIFYGAGAVAALPESHIEWFAGDMAATHPTLPSLNARPLIQKAASALRGGGVLRAGSGSWAIDGEVIDLSGRSFEGAGYGTGQTAFYFNGTKRNGFHLTGSASLGGSVRGCSFNLLNASVSPTEGKVLYTTQSETVFENIETFGAYIGAHFNAMVIGRANNIRHNDCLINPLIIEDSLDVFYDNWNHSALGDLTTMTGTPTGGAFVAGEAVTCATGSSGIVQAAYTSTIYRIQWYGIRPPASSTITATGKSATCASVVVGHQLGSVRFVSTTRLCEGNSILSGDSVGGELQLVAAGTGTIGRMVGNVGDIIIAPDALFDVSYGGSQIDSGYDWKVYGRYASSRDPNAPGLALNACSRIFGEPRGVNNAGAGVQWDGTCQHIYIKANMDGNCRNYTLPDMAEIRVTGNAPHWAIEGGLAGFPGLNGGVDPVRALYVAAGARDFAVNMDCPIGSITNLATSNNQDWGNTPGMFARSPILPAYADDAAAAAGGVPIGGKYRTASAEKQRIA